MLQRLAGLPSREEHILHPNPPTLPRYTANAAPPQFRLSPLDNLQSEQERAIVFYFREAPIDAQRLRQCLEQLLGIYPVLAGRLKKNDGSQGYSVECSDAGAVFEVLRAYRVDKSLCSADDVVPSGCYSKSRAAKYAGRLRDGVFGVRLTLEAKGSTITSALGVTIAAALVDHTGLFTLVETLARLYDGEAAPELMLDRTGVMARVVKEHLAAAVPHTWSLPCYRVQDEGIMYFVKQKLSQTPATGNIFRLTGDDIAKMRAQSGSMEDLESLIMADVLVLLTQLRDATSNISQAHRYIEFAFPVDFRENGLGVDYWGNAHLLTALEVAISDALHPTVANRVSRLAARISEQKARVQTPEYLAKGLEWLRRQEAPSSLVVAHLPEPSISAASHIPINWYGITFGHAGAPIYVNMPTGSAWGVTVVPAPPTAPAAYDLHLALPVVDMEVLQIDWASRCLK